MDLIFTLANTFQKTSWEVYLVCFCFSKHNITGIGMGIYGVKSYLSKLSYLSTSLTTSIFPGPEKNHLEDSSILSIQMAESNHLHPHQDQPDRHHDDQPDYPEPGAKCQMTGLTSLSRLCGLYPGRVLAVSAAVLSVWLTWIIISHLNIQVGNI